MQICIESILWLNVINHFKVKFLCITKYHHDMHHAMKTYKRVEIQLLTFLTWAWGEGVWSASHPGCFTFRERAPGTHWIGGWVGPRIILNAVVKRRISNPSRDSNPRSSSVMPLSYPSSCRYEDDIKLDIITSV